ncbi:MAG: aldehyde dehydrogenase family protein [Spirochaetales bacterium]|nr:MAG: aldehyde dehydrogenase family protein [Spirochaetales bacterium]
MADNLKEMVERARKAQAQIEFWSQEQVDMMVAAAGWEVIKEENAVACAKLAAEETGMGIYENKLLKHKKKSLGTLRDLEGLKTVGLIEDNPKTGIMKFAKPVGVIGALTPVTNPTSTLPGNGLPALKCRNAIIFAPHPRAKGCANLTCDFMRAGLKKVGAPEDLVQCIKEPSVELSQELMKVVDLVIATGGGPLVKVAYSSGTPAYGVGAGNAIMIVDETADLKDAAEKIFKGKTFDNATSCSSENSCVIQESVYDKVVEGLKSHGGYLCSAEEKTKLKATMWPDGIHLNKDIVAQSAKKIAGMAGIAIPENTTMLMVIGEKIGREDMFSAEKLSPVLTLWKYKAFEDAIDYVTRLTAFSGYGHSCGIHTTKDERIAELATKVRVSRIMVRQSQSYGNSGDYNNGMPFTLTLGCGTWGGNIVSENISYKHMMNVTWVAKPITPVLPDEQKIFGAYWNKFGK